VKVFRNHKSYSEADLVEVIVASADRVKPECEYFEICGGCQYQHLSVPAQRDWKRKQVTSLLERIGGIHDVSVNEVVGTAEHYRYRTKITPHYDAPKTVADLKVGFQKRGTRVMIDIPQCIIATDAINAKYLEVRTTLTETMKIKVPKKGATLLLRECEEGVETDHRALISQRVNGVLFRFKAGEFFQNNHFVLPLMVDHVLSKASGDGCTHLIDAYCGSGLFSLCGAKSFETVTGVEVSELAIVAAKASAVENNITNVQFFCSSSEMIFKQVGHLPKDETCILLDPPRKGCDDVFLKQLFAFRPKKIVYVSCDPSTQARDAQAIVQAGYFITDCTPFDLFPQTRHIENVLTFIRAT
jgi:23S rRNA (uracil1939-C5)-methyltransferase/tRNA (uracil-5-)-methyltransferase